MPFLPYISPELINFLIEKEKNEQKKQEKRPFLQVPAPYMPEIIGKNDQNYPENSPNEGDDGAIIIDL